MLNVILMHSPWWLIRLTVFLMIPSIIFDFEILFLIQSLVLVHAKFGLESVISDYVHSTTLRLLYLILIRIFVLEILLYSVEFLL